MTLTLPELHAMFIKLQIAHRTKPHNTSVSTVSTKINVSPSSDLRVVLMFDVTRVLHVNVKTNCNKHERNTLTLGNAHSLSCRELDGKIVTAIC